MISPHSDLASQQLLLSQLLALSSVLATPVKVSLAVDIDFSAPFQLRCPILTKYQACKSSCSCTTGTLNCGSSAPAFCYEGPRGYEGRYPCICFDQGKVNGASNGYEMTPDIGSLPEALPTKVIADEPTSAAESESPWPSMLACPKTMHLDMKNICWKKCGCIKDKGKVCLDGVPQDCRTKCVCSETALVVIEGIDGAQHPMELAEL
jgi:hypothetical protein